MKKILLAAICCACAASLFAEGTASSGWLMFRKVVQDKPGIANRANVEQSDLSPVLENPAYAGWLSGVALNAYVSTVYARGFMAGAGLKAGNRGIGITAGSFERRISGENILYNTGSDWYGGYDLVRPEILEQDTLFFISCGLPLGDTAAAGVTVKRLTTSFVEEFTAEATSIDVGIANAGGNGMGFSLALQNIAGSAQAFLSEPDPLPRALCAGINYTGSYRGRAVYSAALKANSLLVEQATLPAVELQYREAGFCLQASCSALQNGEIDLRYGMGYASGSFRIGITMRPTKYFGTDTTSLVGIAF